MSCLAVKELNTVRKLAWLRAHHNDLKCVRSPPPPLGYGQIPLILRGNPCPAVAHDEFEIRRLMR